MYGYERDWKAAASQRFDSIAEQWRARGLPGSSEVDRLEKLLACPPGGAILDAGCGTGNYSVALAQRGYHITGIDLSSAMIAQARQVAETAGLGTEQASFAVGDVERIDVPDGSVDAVFCRCVLDFAPRPGVALRELERVLRPVGRLILVTLGAHSPVKWEWWRRFLPDYDGPHYANDILPWEVEALLGEMGWQLLDGFPTFGRTLEGTKNPYTEDSAQQLDDRILLQTVASGWCVVAVRG